MLSATFLSAPGPGQQNGKDKAGAVAITWTAPGGYTPTGYSVSRCAGASCTSFQPISSGQRLPAHRVQQQYRASSPG